MIMLDREANEALRAVAAARSPDEGAAERAWAAMQQRLVDGPPALDIDPQRDATRQRMRRLVVGFAVAAVVLLAVGVASWSAGWLAGLDSRSDEQAPYTSEPSIPIAPASAPVVVPTVAGASALSPSLGPAELPAGSGGTTTPLSAGSQEPAVPSPEPPLASASRRGEPRRRPEPRVSSEPAQPEPATTGTTLEAELRLLGQANAAMRAGRHDDALTVLARHAREFENGQLAPEREYKRALALCELGRAQEARAVAKAFAREHPKSPLRAKAQDVCREGVQ
jgi:hypothetical protein